MHPEHIADALGGSKRDGAGWVALCPCHDDRKPSLALHIGDDGRLLWHCRAGCTQDDVRHALTDRGLLNGHARDAMPRRASRPPAATSAPIPETEPDMRDDRMGDPVDSWCYRDAEGRPLYYVARYETPDGKSIRPWTWDGRQWVQRAYPPPRPLYGLDRLARMPGAPVLIVEGEKCAEAAHVALGETWVCATWAGGAGAVEKSDWSPLRARRVLIWPDRDDPGRRAAEAVRRILPDAELLDAGDAGDGWDCADLLDSDGADAVRRFVAERPRVSEKSASIDGARLLDAIRAFLARFVAYPSEDALIAHALWVAHTHLMDVWESTPRLAFLSPEPASGKTRALEITETLVPRPIEAVNATPAYLFRKVSDSAGAPTILFDEIDTLFGPRAKENEEIRGMLNAGHRRGAKAGRCVVRGTVIGIEELPAYCAVALAGLGDLPDTILTRSVIVRMRGRAPTETVEPYRRRKHAPEGNALRDQLAAWAVAIASTLDKTPEMPAGVTDRDADVWEALLSIADAARGRWPERARVAAVTLVTLAKAVTPSQGVRLLADLHSVFGDADVMATDALLKALIGMDESPWDDLRGKPLDGRRLDLHPFAEDGKRGVLSEINVTPLVDVMLVLLIIFMISSSVQTLEMQYERQTIIEAADEKLEEAEALLAELEEKKKLNTKVEIDLPKVDSDVVKLSEVKKLKLEVDDKLRFKIDGTLLVDCLQVSPDMQKYLGAARVADDPDGELAAFEPCMRALGEKLVDNKKLQDDKELYVLASRALHYGQVLRVMASVRQAGVTKFGLVAEPGILGGAIVDKTVPEVK